ncbi:MAG: WD40 repeat domain-containing protein [Planctomycetota bacterium]
MRLWDVTTGREIRRFQENRKQVHAVAYAPDGRYVASGGVDQQIHLWAPQSGREVRGFLQEGLVRALAFSPNGDQILSADRSGMVRLWKTRSGKEVRLLEHPMDLVTSVAISSNGRQALCTGGYSNNSDTPLDTMVRVWNLKNGKVVFDLKSPVRTLISTAAFSPDGQTILAEDPADERCLALWSLRTGGKARRYAQCRAVRCVAFYPDGRRAVAGNTQGVLHVFEVQSGRQIVSFGGHGGSVDCVTISPDGRYALSGGHDGAVRLWRLPKVPDPEARSAGEAHRFIHDAGVYTVAFSPDGRRALTAGFDLTLRLWDVNTGSQLRLFQGQKAWDHINDLAWSPDGRYALLAAGQYQGSQRLSLWDIDAWREVRRYAGHEHIVTCVTFSPDGRFALSGDLTGKARQWNVESGHEIRCYEPPVRGARSLAFSPDASLALYGGGFEDHRVRLWEVDSGREVCLLEGHGQKVQAVLFAPDGRHALSAGSDRSLRVWDLIRKEEVRCMIAPEAITCAALSANGRQAVTGGINGIVRLWDVEKGRELGAFEGHTEKVTSVDFSPDGRQVLSGSYDQTARIWAVPQPEQAETD